ncbi:MAG: RDD family protein [Saprospiraceae bacterium]|nr:RDD family protein [Lewinellaceae bacterium]MBP6811989.1 RDD family protein [Saprospiraceae bacterium]
MNKTIEIRTTQNVTIEYELAGLRERALAWMLDTGIVVVGYYILIILMMVIFGEVGNWWGVFFGIMLFLIYFLYHILFEILRRGQSPGKMGLGIKVVRLDGKDPEWSDVTLRALLQLVDSIFCLGIVGGLLIQTTAKAQRLGDMAANTTIIKLQSTYHSFRLADILSISSLQNYQPVYPQVRNLSERDMIFVKTALTRLGTYPNQAHEELLEDLVTRLMPLIGVEQRPFNRVEFLKTLLKDYIVLTR